MDWLTPPEIIEALGPFDLDPCAGCKQPWPTAARMISLPQDGLKENWIGRVWCNPPFGSETAAWLARCAAHGNAVALAFARTETAMFFESVWPKAAALLFLRGRPHFHRPDGKRAKGNSGGPIVLIAYGRGNAHRFLECGLDGMTVML